MSSVLMIDLFSRFRLWISSANARAHGRARVSVKTDENAGKRTAASGERSESPPNAWRGLSLQPCDAEPRGTTATAARVQPRRGLGGTRGGCLSSPPNVLSSDSWLLAEPVIGASYQEVFSYILSRFRFPPPSPLPLPIGGKKTKQFHMCFLLAGVFFEHGLFLIDTQMIIFRSTTSSRSSLWSMIAFFFTWSDGSRGHRAAARVAAEFVNDKRSG